MKNEYNVSTSGVSASLPGQFRGRKSAPYGDGEEDDYSQQFGASGTNTESATLTTSLD